MARQFVSVRYRKGDRRTYTYHHDGDPVAIGDDVKVNTRDGTGWMRVEVVAISDEQPTFPTKPIIGKLEAGDDGRLV